MDQELQGAREKETNQNPNIMKTKMIIAAMALTIFCGCHKPKSKAAEMNRIADSIYHADSTKLSKGQ